MDKFTIRLKGLRFFSRIGVAGQERRVGNDFEVNITISLPADGFRREDLSSTVSYADVYLMAKECMDHEALLLETVAKDISERISEKWPVIEDVSVEITKLSVPIDGMTGSASVEYFRKKNDEIFG